MKRQSICRQFTVIFVCMTAFVIIAVWCINNWALEDYYMDYKVKVLEQAYTCLLYTSRVQIPPSALDIRRSQAAENIRTLKTEQYVKP